MSASIDLQLGSACRFSWLFVIMVLNRPTAILLTAVLLATCSRPATSDDDKGLLTHPLVPGLHSSELHDTDWARPFHDRVGSGFSPLLCNIDSAPRVWSSRQTLQQLYTRFQIGSGHRGSLVGHRGSLVGHSGHWQSRLDET